MSIGTRKSQFAINNILIVTTKNYLLYMSAYIYLNFISSEHILCVKHNII